MGSSEHGLLLAVLKKGRSSSLQPKGHDSVAKCPVQQAVSHCECAVGAAGHNDADTAMNAAVATQQKELPRR